MRETPASTLHFTCGKMAAGKTTLAKRLAAEHAAILVSWDIWLGRLYPEEIAAITALFVAPHPSEGFVVRVHPAAGV